MVSPSAGATAEPFTLLRRDRSFDEGPQNLTQLGIPFEVQACQDHCLPCWREVFAISGGAQHLQGCGYRGNDFIGSLVDHGPGEAQHTPAINDQEILSPAIGLKHGGHWKSAVISIAS
jgi:hypothetical protein